MTEQNNQKSLAKICHLFCLNKFDEARRSILNAADVPWQERSFKTTEEMDNYILAHTKDPEIKKMVAADRAFTHIGYWYNHSEQLSETVMNENLELFKDLLPNMDLNDALRVKYWQSQMYVYPRLENDAPRYDLLDDLIQNFPLDYSDKDKMLEICAEQVSRMRVPVEDRYKTVKTAQNRSSQDIKHHYNQMLAPLAEKYFDLALREADDGTQNYQARLASYQKIYAVIDDFGVSEDVRRLISGVPGKVREMEDNKKHRHRLLVLSRMSKLHKENGHIEEANALNKKKTDLCVAYYGKYPKFKKKVAYSFDKV